MACKSGKIQLGLCRFLTIGPWEPRIGAAMEGRYTYTVLFSGSRVRGFISVRRGWGRLMKVIWQRACGAPWTLGLIKVVRAWTKGRVWSWVELGWSSVGARWIELTGKARSEGKSLFWPASENDFSRIMGPSLGPLPICSHLLRR
jgi:hypothetical protein